MRPVIMKSCVSSYRWQYLLGFPCLHIFTLDHNDYDELIVSLAVCANIYSCFFNIYSYLLWTPWHVRMRPVIMKICVPSCMCHYVLVFFDIYSCIYYVPLTCSHETSDYEELCPWLYVPISTRGFQYLLIFTLDPWHAHMRPVIMKNCVPGCMCQYLPVFFNIYSYLRWTPGMLMIT